MKSQQSDQMRGCNLALVGQYSFEEMDGSPHVPALPILIFREGLKRSIRTLAIVDTGFDMGLLLSREARDTLITGGHPDKHESLRAGAVEVPCEVFKLSVKVLDRWYSTEGYSPIFPGYESLIGRQIINQLNLCMRGPEKKLHAAREAASGKAH